MKNVETVKLGDLVKIRTGKLDANASSMNGIYPFFTCSREPLRISSYSYDCRCVLVAGNGDLNVKYYEGKFDAYQRTYIIESLDENELDTRYLYHFLAKYIDKLRELSIGGVIKYIKLNNLTDPLIPLPSLEAQKRIVRELDAADALRQKRKQAIALLDEYLKALFLEMFGDPVENPKGWRVTKLEDLSKKITDGTHKTPKYQSRGVKFISAKNIKNGQIVWEDIKYISEAEHADIFRRCNPYKDDLLLTKSGSLGMCALVDVDFEFSLFESLALIKIKDGCVDPIYLREYLNLAQVKKFYEQITKGVGVKHLHLIDIKSLPIILPLKEMQSKFAEIVMKVEKLKEFMIMQSRELEINFNALMQKAFEEKAVELKQVPAKIKNVRAYSFGLMQGIAAIVEALGETQVQYGEMVTAKFLYLLQEVFKVPFGVKFSKNNFGPYNPDIKKAIESGISKSKYFARRNNCLVLGEKAGGILKETYPLIIPSRAAMGSLLEHFKHAPSKRIELVATICKAIEDSQSTDLQVIQRELADWRTPGAEGYATKADKFSDSVAEELATIKRLGWDKVLSGSNDQ